MTCSSHHRLALMLSIAAVLLTGYCVPVANGQDAAAPKAPKTHTLRRGPFKIEVELDGVFEARTMTPIVLRPESWTDFSVLEAVEQGQRVKKGDTLVKLDMIKIDRAIADIEVGQELAHLSLQQTEEETRALEKSVPLDLRDAQRTKTIADEDLKLFLEEGRTLSEKSARQSLKQMHNYLENQMEELHQLEKMYEADDLTEETEEIIIKRQRDSVESARFSVERAESRAQRTLKFDLPRREDSLKTAAAQSSLALEKANATLPSMLRGKQLSLLKSRYDQRHADNKLEQMRADRELMAITAPGDGVVYYGKCVNGKWTTSAAVAAKMRQGGKISAHEVFMTLVQPRPLFIRAELSEKDVLNVRAGADGTALATFDPDLKSPVEVDKVSPIPVSGTKFDVQLSVELPRSAAAVMPGMTCKVKVVSYESDDALTVPNSSVFTDSSDEDRRYVLIELDDGEHEERTVKVGRKSDKLTEVLDGLEDGEKILTSKPKEEDDE